MTHAPKRDDAISAAAIGPLAVIAASMVHEIGGHGSVCLSTGGQALIHPYSMQCSTPSALMVAAGPLTNLVCGLLIWAALRVLRGLPVHLRYFLWLVMAYDLFQFAGYLALGAAIGFGDWAVLMAGVAMVWKAVTAVAALALYYGAMHAVARAGREFLAAERGPRLTLMPYLAAGVVSAAAGLLTPLGVSYAMLSAAASFGAGFGLLGIRDWGGEAKDTARLTRSYAWIAASAVVSCAFVFLVSRGMPLGR